MKKIAVWGKFDRLHQGHLEFLRHAKELGDELYVIVVSDDVIRENNGNPPRKVAKKRKEDLLKIDFIKDIYASASFRESIDFLLRLKPDIFAFGHDQKTKWEEELKKELSSQGLYPQYVYLGVYNNGIHSRDLA